MRSIVRILGSRWFLSFIGIVLLALLVWWFGPFLPALEGWIPRAAIIAAMALAWAGANLLLDLRRRRRDAALVAGATQAEPDHGALASAEEEAALHDKLTAALTMLRKASGSRGYLYEQPWYAIIGPPGTGKTTALLNAGLKFPLAAEMGQKVAGFGGTRMCDWWFTDDAVLIDTAGRYTTQEDSTVDKAGWNAFLSLLRRTRTRQPLNGLIVVFALQDAQQPESSIGGSTPAQRSAHAATIRRRIKDVYEQLGVRVPVYAVFTKADLVAGFVDFFSDLDREKLGQVWGMTFPLAVSRGGAAKDFANEYALLMQRLNDRLLDRLQAERGADRRPLIADFPAQMVSLQQPLSEFITEAFGASRLDAAPMLRGVYFTSGTQEGTPIDRLTAVMARSFGIDQVRARPLTPERGRSYFLTRLLKDVIFNESMLVSRNPAAVRRNRLLRAGAAVAAVLVAAAGAGALLQTRAVNNAATADAGRALDDYTAAAQALPLDPVRDADLRRILPVLDKARALPFGDRDSDASVMQLFPGLSQIPKLRAGAETVYRNALRNVLLPRLILRLENQMRQNFDKPTFLYEATRIYMELGSLHSPEPTLIKQWMHYDWASAFSSPADSGVRHRLEQHLAALLDEPLPKYPLDGALIDSARSTFSRVSLADRVYSAIRTSPQAAALPPWRPSDAAGPAGVRLFHRRSGLPMTDGIAGFFTVEGFYKVLLPQLPSATRQAESESWLLGPQAEIDPTSPQALSLLPDVIALYEKDYEKTWDALLGDIDIDPLDNMQQAIQALYILSSPLSPMRDLLNGIVRQLTLSVPPASGPGAATGVAAAANAVDSRLQNLFKKAEPSAEPPGKAVETYYAPLIAYVGKGPGAPIDMLLKLLNDLQQQLARLSATPQGASVASVVGSDPTQPLLAEASRAPEPIRRWITALTGGGDTLRSRDAQKSATAAFNAPGGPAALCRQAVAGRYPFSPSSPNGIPLDDFARLFAPNGLLDQFFTTQLRPFVDTSGPVWRAQAVDGVAPPVSPGALAQFQRAAAIRDLFFANGGSEPTVRFDIQPLTLDSGATQVTLDFDGRELVYAHGPLRGMSVTWPGPNHMNNVRLVFDSSGAGGPAALQATGPWALFRLFGQGHLARAGSADEYVLSFDVGDHHVTYQIRASSVLNPFMPGVLRDFRCPSL